MDEGEARWLTAGEQRAWRSFLTATQLLLSTIEAQLQRESSLPHGYYEILVRLSEAPGRALRMSQLAEASSSSKSRLSHAVARLEERGWVQRLDCPTDRRGQVAQLTEAGFTALEAAAPGHVEQVRRSLFDVLSADQVAQLAAISDAIIAAVPADGVEGSCHLACGEDEPCAADEKLAAQDEDPGAPDEELTVQEKAPAAEQAGLSG